MANETTNELSDLSKYLSQNIQQLRKKRNLSQSSLAKIAGVPRSTVTHLESGAGNPSLHNLVRIALGLQVTVEELLSKPRNQCTLLKSTQIPKQKRAQGMVHIHKLLPDPIPGMELDRMEIEHEGRMGGIPHTLGTKEYFVCVRGVVEVHVAGQSYRVESGDVLAFPGDQAHSYRNIGPGKADCFSVVVIAPSFV